MTILKGIPAQLPPDLLYILAKMVRKMDTSLFLFFRSHPCLDPLSVGSATLLGSHVVAIFAEKETERCGKTDRHDGGSFLESGIREKYLGIAHMAGFRYRPEGKNHTIEISLTNMDN